jgi:hypothetical protein
MRSSTRVLVRMAHADSQLRMENRTMSSPHDEFDLDVRFSGSADGEFSQLWGENTLRPAVEAMGVETLDDTCGQQATCPAHTCELACQTQTCPEQTCGCNTDTCVQQACQTDAITFPGQYCEDPTDTCAGAGCGGGGDEPPGPPDSLGCPPSEGC